MLLAKLDTCAENIALSIPLFVDLCPPMFSTAIERAEGHFCPNLLNDDHLNVSSLLSNLLSKRFVDGGELNH